MFSGVPIIILMLPALVITMMVMIWFSTRTNPEKKTKQFRSEPRIGMSHEEESFKKPDRKRAA
jgi:hypothetical protein